MGSSDGVDGVDGGWWKFWDHGMIIVSIVESKFGSHIPPQKIGEDFKLMECNDGFSFSESKRRV